METVARSLALCQPLRSENKERDCAGKYEPNRCNYANMVTDVVVTPADNEATPDGTPGAKAGSVVVLDPRTGGIVAMETAAKSNPDGYTLVSVIPAHAANQTLYPKLPYDSLKSFEPVSLLGTAPLIACVTNGLPVKSVKELVEHAKAGNDVVRIDPAWDRVRPAQQVDEQSIIEDPLLADQLAAYRPCDGLADDRLMHAKLGCFDVVDVHVEEMQLAVDGERAVAIERRARRGRQLPVLVLVAVQELAGPHRPPAAAPVRRARRG